MSTSKRKHHFVPQFYLRHFGSAPKQIHLYHFRNNLFVENATLRDQCYKHRFHGDTDDVENELQVVESDVGPVIQSVVTHSTLPQPGSQERILLFLFVALQMCRTSIAARSINSGLDRMIKLAYHDDPRLQGVSLDSVQIGYEHPVLASLGFVRTNLECLLDLQAHLVCASEDQFLITSDNPVFKYNQYCQTVRGMGHTGTLRRGLELFVPISPKHVLLLYDGKVYKVGNKRSDVTGAVPDADVATLNLLQGVSAEESVYFSEWRVRPRIEEAVGKWRRYRRSNRTRAEEFPEVGNEDQSSLLHLFESMPNLSLDLSFISLRRNARKVPIKDRIRQYRREIPGLTSDPEGQTPIPSSVRKVFARP